jgi:hypothetical protein
MITPIVDEFPSKIEEGLPFGMDKKATGVEGVFGVVVPTGAAAIPVTCNPVAELTSGVVVAFVTLRAKLPTNVPSERLTFMVKEPA